VKRVTAHVREIRRVVATIMQRGIRDRVLRALDVELLTSAYLGLLRQCFFDALVLGTPLPTAGAILAVFLDGAARPGSRR
jgi:hypothetical protein